MPDRVFLVDGSAFAFRAFFALKGGFTDKQGRPTGAVYGFTRILLKLLREQNPDYLAVVFDAKGKNFRHELYPEYKANRPPTPPDLALQFQMMDQVIEALNIPLLRIEGVEADDVLGTLARHAVDAGHEAVIVTGDKDLLQLVGGRIVVYDPGKGDSNIWYTPEEVMKRMGVGPEHVIDLLALMGDSADNVPGVPGIGEKTAASLLAQYGSLENLYAHVDELKGKQRERLEANGDLARLCRTLVTVRTDVELPIELEALRCQPADHAKLAEVFSELAFQSLLEEYLPEAGADEQLDYVLVLSEKQLDKALKEMRAAGRFAVDTETTSVDPIRAELVGISLSCKAQTGYYIPVGHTREALTLSPEGEGLLFGEELHPVPRATVLAKLKPLLEDASIGKIGHNIKYDLIVFARAGIQMRGVVMDTMVASYLTDPSRLRHNLTEVSLQYLKRKTIPITDLIGKGSKALTFDQVPVDRACNYACEDADMAWRLAGFFAAPLHERALTSLLTEIELPLIGVLARMEMTGIAIDAAVFETLRTEVEKRLGEIEQEVYTLAGETFSIQSPKQLQHILFEKLGLKPLRKTKTGYSTDVDVLEELALEHSLPEKILAFRTLEKLRGTYIDALPRLVNPATGRIHTSFNQAVAATGRLSSSDPNLQNIPVRTELGRKIREGFIPGEPGQRLISADYSQIELRILAHLSGDEGLLHAFQTDADVHRETAARAFGVPLEAVTAEQRRQAKAINFGVIYGMSPFGLAKSLGIPQSAAARFIDQYFAQYPRVRNWIDETLAGARERGFVTTLFNRRRYIADLASSDANVRKAAERIAINTPVQGSAADIIKAAMVRLDARLQGARARLLLQVHDELLVETPEEDAVKVAEQMREAMEQVFTLKVPLKADMGIGRNWAEVH